MYDFREKFPEAQKYLADLKSKGREVAIGGTDEQGS